MKRYFFLLIASFTFFSGCTSMSEFKDFSASLTTVIPNNVEEAAARKVNAETELYAIGSANIRKNDLAVTNSKAYLSAKEKLRGEIRKEVRLHFNADMMNLSSQTKKNLAPHIPKLVEQIIDSKIGDAREKGTWDDGLKSYALVTISRSEVKEVAKSVFTNYIETLEKE